MQPQKDAPIQEVLFLSEASKALSASLDFDITLNKIVQLAVRYFGGWCTVDLLSDQEKIQRVATGCIDKTQEKFSIQRFQDFSINLNARKGPARVIRTGKPEFIKKITKKILASYAKDENHLKTMLNLGLKCGICFPLSSRKKILGAISFISTDRVYTPAEYSLAEELARRCATALDNAVLYQEAKAAIRVRDEFLSIASHELQTPLTPLKLRIQMIKRIAEKDPGAFSQQLLQLLDVSDRQIRRFSYLIENLLDVSRITTGTLRLKLKRMNFGKLVEEVLQRYKEQLAFVQCKVELKLDKKLYGVWDRLRIEQVLINLLTNSMKYGAGKPIKIQLRKHDSFAELSVIDHGIGIAKKNQTRIFERFERGGVPNGYGGLGLGLYIIQQIINAHGGAVSLKSKPHKGANFTIRLPF